MTTAPAWYLHRKNCASCAKSLAWLEQHDLEPTEVVDARREKFSVEQSIALMNGCDEVWVARGKSWQSFQLKDAVQREAMLGKAIGPHGTLRAPSMRFGSRFVVGFHEDMLDQACGLAEVQPPQ